MKIGSNYSGQSKQQNFLQLSDLAKKKSVFTVTRPTLIFNSDPMNFYTEFR